MTRLQFDLPDSEASERFAAALADALADRSGAVIYLQGDLGAGKTTIARALLRRLGVQGAIRSPTYTIMEPYEIEGRRLLHMDLYRIEAADLEQLGLDDYSPRDTIWLVEWPEKADGELPPFDLDLRLQHTENGRRLQLEAAEGWERALQALPAQASQDSA